MSTWRRSAFTLMEIMMVVLLTALLLIPLFKALRTGMKVSLKGMLKPETTLVARRILRQVQTDLEHVCFPLDAQGATISPQTLVRFAGAPPTTSSSFFSFPVHGAVDSIISDMESEYEREVPSTVIGQKVMDRLEQLDEVAYVRFASVYRRFRDVNQFLSEVEGLIGRE